MTNFNKTLFYCSDLSQIMAGEKAVKALDKKIEAQNKEISEIRHSIRFIKDKKSNMIETRRADLKAAKSELSRLKKDRNSPIITDGCEKLLTQLYGYLKYKKWNLPSGPMSAQAEKGIVVEPLAIEMLSRADNLAYHKNETRICNNFILGIPDIISGSKVIDIKSSRDMDTFMPHLRTKVEAAHWWQMQGYLAITGFEYGEIVFCLVSTPKDMAIKYAERVAEFGKYTKEQVLENLDYDTIPESERIIRYIIKRDDAAIGKIPAKIRLCRRILNEIQKQHIGPTPAKSGLLAQMGTPIPDAEPESNSAKS